MCDDESKKVTRLLIDGRDYCTVLEIVIDPRRLVPDMKNLGKMIEVPQHRLILDRTVGEVDILDSRQFSIQFVNGPEVAFEVYEAEEDGCVLLGCPNP